MRIKIIILVTYNYRKSLTNTYAQRAKKNDINTCQINLNMNKEKNF